MIVAGDEETRPSLGSSTRARQSSLCSAAQASEVGRSKRHHGWASSGKLGRNQHWGRGGRTERGSPPVTARASEAAWPDRKGRGSWSPSLRGTRVEVWLPARRSAVAEVDRRRLASNKLGKRAPKRAAGSSERGPSSSLEPAGETVGARVQRNEESRVGLTGKDGRGPARDPGCREIGIQRSSHRQKRWGGRGAGAVMATGSYEGSLSTEDIPDHHEASLFTGRRPRWSRRLSASSDPYVPTLRKGERADGEDAAPAKASEAEGERGVATGMSEARSQRHRGKKTPTLVSEGREGRTLEEEATLNDPPKRPRTS